MQKVKVSQVDKSRHRLCFYIYILPFFLHIFSVSSSLSEKKIIKTDMSVMWPLYFSGWSTIAWRLSLKVLFWDAFIGDFKAAWMMAVKHSHQKTTFFDDARAAELYQMPIHYLCFSPASHVCVNCKWLWFLNGLNAKMKNALQWKKQSVFSLSSVQSVKINAIAFGAHHSLCSNNTVLYLAPFISM